MSDRQRQKGIKLNRQRQMGTQAEADGGLHPTGGDRWDMYSTGRDRRGHNPTGTQRMRCTQQVKTGTRVKTETGTPQHKQAGGRKRRPVSEAQVDRQMPGPYTQAGKTHRKSDPGLNGRALGSRWSAGGGEGGAETPPENT